MLLGLITSQPPFLYPWTESKLFFINFGSKIPGRSSSLHPLSTSPPLSGVGGGIGTTVSHTCRLRTLRALDFDLERGQNYRALIGKEVKRERSNEPWPLSARVCRPVLEERKEGRRETYQIRCDIGKTRNETSLIGWKRERVGGAGGGAGRY